MASVGAALSFDASGSSDNVAIASYEWDFGDGPLGTGETSTHTHADPGTYTVTLTVRDAAGNADTDSLIVTVETEPETPPPGLQVSPSVGTFAVVGVVARCGRRRPVTLEEEGKREEQRMKASEYVASRAASQIVTLSAYGHGSKPITA